MTRGANSRFTVVCFVAQSWALEGQLQPGRLQTGIWGCTAVTYNIILALPMEE